MSPIRKFFATSGATVVLAASLASVNVTAAEAAVTNSCSSAGAEREVTGYNEYRARASCSSLKGNFKARAKLIRDGGPDFYSQYFTKLNTSYYTDWKTCYAGCRHGYEVAQL